MTRELTADQLTNVEESSTRPVIVFCIAHRGTPELLSASGEIVYNEELYAAGGASLGRIANNETATFSLPATSARINEVISGSWRNGVCKIYFIPGLPADTGEYDEEDAVLLLDGTITRSVYSGAGVVTCTAMQSSLADSYTPTNLISEVCNHIDPPSTVLGWQGDKIVLEAR